MSYKKGAKRMVDLCGKGHMPLIPVCCKASVNATTVDALILQFPFPVIARRIYGTSADTVTGDMSVIVTDGTDTETAQGDTNAEVCSSVAGSQQFAADTDITIQLECDNAGAVNICAVVFFQPCGEFYDEG